MRVECLDGKHLTIPLPELKGAVRPHIREVRLEKDVGAVIAHNEVRPRVYRSKYDADSQQQRIILEIGVLLALLGVNRVPVDLAEQPVIKESKHRGGPRTL